MGSFNFYLFVYDIVDDGRRIKVASDLEAVGERVQYSVFEVHMSLREVDRLIKRLQDQIDSEEDSIRIYYLCRACKGKIKTIGVGEVSSSPEVKII